MGNKILITGGTGLVGGELKALLQNQNYEVALLSRQTTDAASGIYNWNIKAQTIDPQALENIHGIVHLAGAGVADGRWTEKRKKAILQSRIESTNLLYDQLKSSQHRPKVFVSASAVGIYGSDTGDQVMSEDSVPANDFLADVVVQWEAAVDRIKELDIRVVKLRIGIVLAEDGGALPEIVQPIKLWAGAPLGSGQQYMSWIHIDDLAHMMIWSLEQESVNGIYNAVGPNPATNEELTKAAAKVLSKPLFLPNVPEFVIKLMFGEMGAIILGGNRVSNDKISSTGFSYRFEELKPALEDLLLT
jgi:hypothetical protein